MTSNIIESILQVELLVSFSITLFHLCLFYLQVCIGFSFPLYISLSFKKLFSTPRVVFTIKEMCVCVCVFLERKCNLKTTQLPSVSM